MGTRLCPLATAALTASLLAGGVLAQTEGPDYAWPEAGSIERARDRPPVLRVAVLPFEYDESAESRIGQRVAELLSEALALNPDWEIVGPDAAHARSRRSLPRMTALVLGNAAAELADEVGADAVVTGQIYALGGRFYLVAKLVGCRSQKVFGVGADASNASSLTDLMSTVAEGLDGLLAERRHALASPTPKLRSVEETLKSQVTVLRRQKEPPPIIVLVADMEETVPAADEAVRRLVQRVRRTGMSAQSPKVADLVEWVRALHAQTAHGVPAALEGQGIVLAARLQTEVAETDGSFHLGHGLIETIWLDARDGAELGRGRAERFALGLGRDRAAAAAARVVAQETFETTLGEVLGRWEARHSADENPVTADAGASPRP